MEKSGLIVEGGGMKCAYSAGILDAFLDDNVTFDYCMGYLPVRQILLLTLPGNVAVICVSI